MNQNPPELKLKSKPFIFLLAISIACGSFVMGHALVSTALLQKQIQTYNSLSHQNIEFYLSIIVTLLPLGALVGSFLSTQFVNYLGQKNAMISVDILMIVAIVLQSMSLDLNVLYITRFIFGIFCGISSSIIPPYLTSISPLNMVGIIGALSQLLITIGISAAYAMDFFLQSDYMDKQSEIKIFILVPLPFCAVRILSLFFIFPYDTVERHFQNKQMKKVEQIMRAIYQDNTSFQVFCQVKNLKSQVPIKKSILHQVQQQTEKQYLESNQRIVKKTHKPATLQQKQQSKRRILMLAVVLGVANQLCGINAIFFYAKQLFTNLTNNDQDLVKQDLFGIGIFQVFITLLASFVLDKFGRKFFMILGHLIVILSLFGAYLSTDLLNLSSNVVVLFVFLHVLGFSISLGPICCLYASQIMQDISPIITLIWSLTLVVSLISDYMINNLGIGKTFLIFGVISLGCFIYIYRQMIESKGLTRRQLQLKFGAKQGYQKVRVEQLQEQLQKCKIMMGSY